MKHARLLEYLISFKNSQNEELFELIINEFKNLIKKYINKVEEKDREDIEQEILMKIYKICYQFKVTENLTKEDNENQFIKYITLTIKNTYIDYLRTKQSKLKLFENIDIKDERTDNSLLFDELTSDEMDFLYLFYEEGKIISEKKVAKKTGISQQAVHKRLVKIRNKIKK